MDPISDESLQVLLLRIILEVSCGDTEVQKLKTSLLATGKESQSVWEKVQFVHLHGPCEPRTSLVQRRILVSRRRQTSSLWLRGIIVVRPEVAPRTFSVAGSRDAGIIAYRTSKSAANSGLVIISSCTDFGHHPHTQDDTRTYKS